MIRASSFYALFIFLLFFICTEIIGQDNCITLYPEAITANNELIEKCVTQPFELNTITYDSDVYIQHVEFDYLVGLHEGSMVCADDIKQAVFYLFQKNKFKEIIIQFSPLKQGRMNIHIRLIGLWTFAKLVVQGIWVGKEAYKQYYLMEPGDPFDKQKHKHSLEKIQESFKKEGYLSGSVTSSFNFNHETKTVTIYVSLNKGKRFVIRDVYFDFKADENVACEELLFLKNQIKKRFLKRLVKSYFTKSVLEQQARLIKEYLAQKGFLHVLIELEQSIDHSNNCVKLHWNIDLHHKRLFIFFGNSFFTNNQLLDYLLQFGRSASLLPASMLSEEIIRAYHKKGFWDVSVESREEDDRYFFIIKEGNRAIIESIECNNTQHFRSNFLIKRCFSGLKKRYFDHESLTHSLDDLVSLYLNEGFLDVKIVSHNFLKSDEVKNVKSTQKEQHYKLVITIDEGICNYLTSVTIPLFPELERQQPFSALNKKHNKKLFNPNILQEQKKILLHYCHAQGYLQASVKPELMKDEANGVSLIWQIELGEKYYFGKTVLLGSSTFPFEHLKRELLYAEGDVWDQKKVQQTFLRLKELEIFESAYLSPLYNIEHMTHKPVLLKIQEDDVFELRMRTGFELEHIREYQTLAGLSYKVGSTFIIKNPFDRADQFRFDIDLTRRHREIVARYISPWIFDVPIKILVQGYSIKYDQPSFIGGSKKNIYDVKQNGFLIGLSKKNNYLDAGTNVGFEWMETSISNANKKYTFQLAKAIDFEPRLLGDRVPFLFIEPTLFVDFLDNNLNPTCGLFSVISAKGMFPLTSAHKKAFFARFLFEQSVFIPLHPLIFALRIRFGHIFHQKFCEIMPTERFYLGGANSLRSYETDLAPPLGCFRNDCDKEVIVPRGGKSMLNGNIELRFPIVGTVGGVIFQDFGVLSGDNFADFKANNVLAGTGFGLRYYTPIGPLRFDIGWKWRLVVPFECSFAWFLTFGHAF